MFHWSRRHLVLVAAAASVTVASGCAGAGLGQPQPGSTVTMSADYPPYEQSTLAEKSTLVGEGTVISAEPTVITPRFEGDSAEENPLYGLTEEEKRQALEEDAGIPGTAVQVRLDVVHKGDAAPGDVITVIQTGGLLDGVHYVSDTEQALELEGNYLLFAGDSFDGTYSMLGGSAGIYEEVAAEEFAPVDPEMAPFAEITSEEAAEVSS